MNTMRRRVCVCVESLFVVRLRWGYNKYHRTVPVAVRREFKSRLFTRRAPAERRHQIECWSVVGSGKKKKKKEKRATKRMIVSFAYDRVVLSTWIEKKKKNTNIPTIILTFSRAPKLIVTPNDSVRSKRLDNNISCGLYQQFLILHSLPGKSVKRRSLKIIVFDVFYWLKQIHRTLVPFKLVRRRI